MDLDHCRGCGGQKDLATVTVTVNAPTFVGILCEDCRAPLVPLIAILTDKPDPEDEPPKPAKRAGGQMLRPKPIA